MSPSVRNLRMCVWLVLYFLLQYIKTNAQVFFKGECPRTPVISDFDWFQYMGIWYEQERYFTVYQNIGVCWRGEYLLHKQKDKGLAVMLSFQDPFLHKTRRLVVDVTAARPHYAPNRLTYHLPGIPFWHDDYEIIATDYKSWTLEYACKDKKPFGHVKFAWILTREAHPDYSVIDEAKTAMEKYGISTRYLRKRNKYCFPTYGHGYKGN